LTPADDRVYIHITHLGTFPERSHTMPRQADSEDAPYIRPRPTTCPKCNGKRSIPHKHTDKCLRDGDTILCRMEVDLCPECGGSGVILR